MYIQDINDKVYQPLKSAAPTAMKGLYLFVLCSVW